MNLIRYFFIPILLLPLSLNAQQNELSEIRDIFDQFGEVSNSELQKVADHDYPFEYLIRESSVRFREDRGSIEAVIDHYVRIKIYSDDPIEIADAALIAIPYYYADNMEQIINLRATTHLPDGFRSLLNSNQVSRSDLNTRYRILEFDMPDVEKGAVLEYKYTVIRRYIEELPDFYFSYQVPVLHASIQLKYEEFLRYDAIKVNTDFDVEFTEQRIDTSNVPHIFTYSRPEPITIYTWTARDVPAADYSEFISSIDDIRGKIKFQISEFGIPRQPLDNSWDVVAAQIRRNANPELQLKRKSNYLEKGQQILNYFDGNLAEAQDSIYSLVNTRSQFNELNSVFADGRFDHVLEGEPADQAEINMALLTMLRGAGIESYPLYISGRDFGRINPSFPSLYQFNRMLVYSRIDGEEYFMDASFANSYPNLIPVESFNEKGFLLKEKEFEWVDITPTQSLFDLEIDVIAELSAEGNLSGEISAVAGGYPAQQIMQQMDRRKPFTEIIQETFLDVYPDAEITDPQVRTINKGRDVEINGRFLISDYAISFSDGLEIRPMIVGYLFRNPFEESERRVPITLDAPEELVINYTVKFPDGFGVEAFSDALETSMSGAELVEEYHSSGNEVNYTFKVMITRREFPAEAYSQLRRIYERWVELSNETWLIRN